MDQNWSVLCLKLFHDIMVFTVTTTAVQFLTAAVTSHTDWQGEVIAHRLLVALDTQVHVETSGCR